MLFYPNYSQLILIPDAKKYSLSKLLSSNPNWIHITMKRLEIGLSRFTTHGPLCLTQIKSHILKENLSISVGHFYRIESVSYLLCCPMESDNSDHWELIQNVSFYLRREKNQCIMVYLCPVLHGSFSRKTVDD